MNRRDFIKTTGAGVFSIASAKALFGAPPSGKVSVAIIGCARTAQHENGCVVDPTGWRGRGFQLMSRFAADPQYLEEQGWLAGEYVKTLAGATNKVLTAVGL